jgi:hypothetical protein
LIVVSIGSKRDFEARLITFERIRTVDEELLCRIG